MSLTPTERVISSIDTFISAQIPQASEVIFAYEPSTNPEVPYKVTVVSIYDSLSPDAIASRPELHSEGVVNMENFLGTVLPTVLSSKHVLNFVLGNNKGKFGVALLRSEDRIDRRPVVEEAEEPALAYYDEN